MLARVEHDRGDAVEEPYSTGLILGYLRDWKIWEFTLYLILNNTALYAFSYFLPVILNKGFGYSVGYSQLMTFPPYAVAAVWIMICAAVGDYFKFRGPILVFNCILYMIGVSITGYAKDAHARYAGVFLGVMGILGNIPTQWAYQHNNMVGQKKKAIAITAMIMGGAFGGIIAGNIFVAADSPNYRKGFWICISFQVSTFIASKWSVLTLTNIIRLSTFSSFARTLCCSTSATDKQIVVKLSLKANQVSDILTRNTLVGSCSFSMLWTYVGQIVGPTTATTK